MAFRFSKHYTQEEARELLPQIREWLDQMSGLRSHLGPYDKRIAEIIAAGCDAGGEPVDQRLKTQGAIQTILGEFRKREIQLKDLDRGLIDFPAFIGGQEAFLCWEKDEDDVEFWHDLTSGYGGRERLK